MNGRKGKRQFKFIRWEILRRGEQVSLAIAGVSFFVVAALILWNIAASTPSRPDLSAAPILSPGVAPTATLNPSRQLVGIVSGHSGYDSGAVCPDGLTEAQLNKTVALEVIDLLHRKKIDAILLDEFDPRLDGFQANALVSIHADSCDVPGATGFKAARVTFSAIPQAEDRLVACLLQEYGKYTGLPEHLSSITDGMTNYHAFREIAPETPGAIIETGFMLEDRQLLEKRPKIVARGIAAGILCFLDGQNNE